MANKDKEVFVICVNDFPEEVLEEGTTETQVRIRVRNYNIDEDIRLKEIHNRKEFSRRRNYHYQVCKIVKHDDPIAKYRGY